MVIQNLLPRRARVIAWFAWMLSTAVANGSAYQGGTPPAFPAGEFEAREDTAMWLVRYDRAAWKSSDLVMQASREELQKLGPEWYCTEDGRTWDCYYGNYDAGADRYNVVFHYRSTGEDSFRRVDDVPPADEATLYARALYRSREAFPKEFQKATFRFNAFVRKMPTGQIEVWHLPAWQQDGTLVYGGELCQTFDQTATKVEETKVSYNGFRSTKPNAKTELRLDNPDSDIATVGSLFFILSYRDQFKSVSVRGRRFITSRVSSGVSGDVWVHVER